MYHAEVAAFFLYPCLKLFSIIFNIIWKLLANHPSLRYNENTKHKQTQNLHEWEYSCMTDCLVKMNQMKDRLAPAERQAVLCFLENPAGMRALSIDEAAQQCGISKATLVRMCKSLGYKGYKDFSFAFSLDVASGTDIVYADLSPGDDVRTLIGKVTRQNMDALRDTMRLLSEKDVNRAAEALHAAPRVDFYGVGMSALVAQDAQMKFQRLCKDTQASPDPHVQVVTAARLRQGDAAVIFSYSGETKDVLQTLAAVKRAGATAISVTRLGSSPLSRGADIALHVASSEMLVRSAAMSSRMAMMHVIDILYSAVAARGYAEYKPALDKTHLEGKYKKK